MIDWLSDYKTCKDFVYMPFEVREGMMYVYVLKDPRNREIRYAGVTNNPMRRHKHICHADQYHNRLLGEWINEVCAIDLYAYPEMHVILEVEKDRAFWIETGVIKGLHEAGNNLLNIEHVRQRVRTAQGIEA